MSTPTFVLDASAVLAFLNGEPGQDVVADALQSAHCVVTAANQAEIIAKALDRGHSMEGIQAILAELAYDVVDTTAADGTLAGQLRVHTRAAGLSLGDRLCLASAIRLNATVLTADRPWLALAEVLGLDIRGIRPESH
jgi:PIN domain nuclease of toxin-antitoxin system